MAKSRHKPRPFAIYREEEKNEYDEWVCSRMTYNPELFDLWESGYEKYIEGGRPKWMNERRFVVGNVAWPSDPGASS